MALDRQSIEKRDFPIGRRGYEPQAVDAHLERVADEVERLQRQVDQPSGASAAQDAPAAPAPAQSAASLAVAASEQVRSIVAAAEASAAAIEQAAQAEGDRIRAEAQAEARETRDEALSQSAEHVGSVREATQAMLGRLEAMDGELGALSDALRTGGNRLNADLSLLQGNLGELYDATGADAPLSVVSSPAPAPVIPAAEEIVVQPQAIAPTSVDAPPPPTPVVEPAVVSQPAAPAATPAPKPAPEAPVADVEGARLVALNMALNGQSRDETDRYLAENFDLADRDGLLDEVYATTG